MRRLRRPPLSNGAEEFRRQLPIFAMLIAPGVRAEGRAIEAAARQPLFPGARRLSDGGDIPRPLTWVPNVQPRVGRGPGPKLTLTQLYGTVGRWSCSCA
jgi:hypothetical protein